MNYGFCPICGERLVPKSNRCRVCDFEIDSDYYPYLDEERNIPDTWDDSWIPDDTTE